MAYSLFLPKKVDMPSDRVKRILEEYTSADIRTVLQNKYAGGGHVRSKKLRDLVRRINETSKADFVRRLLDENRKVIKNPDGTVSTHELGYVDDGKGNAVVFPDIQTDGDSLKRFPFPQSYQRAVERGDTLNMSTSNAKLFTENYKNYYPGFKNYSGGGSKKSDYTPSQSIIDYIKQTESFRDKWYDDGNGIPTVGYGFTGDAVRKLYPNGMNRKQADAYFDTIVRDTLPNFIAATPNFDKLSQSQRDALFSYYYNIGHGGYTRKSPAMQQALRDLDYETVAKNIDFGYNDRGNSGLRKRRDYERSLFLSGVDTSDPFYPSPNAGYMWAPPVETPVQRPVYSYPRYEQPVYTYHPDHTVTYQSQSPLDHPLMQELVAMNSYSEGGPKKEQERSKEGGYTSSEEHRSWINGRYDPTYGFDPLSVAMNYITKNQSHGEENEYWRAYLGLDNNVPKMNPGSKTEWDDRVEAEKVANGELPSDFYGTTPRMDQMLQVVADTLNTGRILRNYDEYKKSNPNLAAKHVIKNMYEQGKEVLNNPGKWTPVKEKSQMYVFNREYPLTGERMPLGMLRNFGMKWEPDEKKLHVHDTYDFPGYVTSFSRIPVRPKEMKIRGVVGFDPRKGSVLLRNGEINADKEAFPIADKTSHR